MPRETAPRLDPRAPLVYDTRDLPRRPGAMRRVRRAVPAPPGLHLGLLDVPAGQPLDLDLRMESVLDGVLISGSVRAPLTGSCGRCLRPLAESVTVQLRELFSYDPVDDGETWPMSGELLDLEPAVRDALLLTLPLTPLCRVGCPGLCPTCGALLDEVDADHHHPPADPRWAALHALINDEES